MTQMNQARGLDSDRVDGGRRPWRPVAVALVLGLVIGALLGGLYGVSKKTTYQATTALSVLPDSLVNTEQGQNSPTVDATSFIQSQLVVLNGSTLADTVQKTLSLSARPSVSSTQVGQSYVVQVSATADTRDQALALATTTASAYASQRSKQLAAAITASAASINAQLTAVKTNLAAAQASTPITSGLTPSETALQTEYERLLGISSALKLALPQVGQVVTVLSPASVAPSSVSATSKYLIGGAVLGALLGLALLVLLRRAFPRVRTVGDVASLGTPVLLPVVPRRSRRGSRGEAAWRSGAGRLLAARLTGHGPSQDAIVVVGATPGVGTSFVAATLAGGLAERGPVLLVLAAEMLDGSGGRQLGPAAPGTGAQLPADNPTKVADLIQAAVPSSIPGVWLLPCEPAQPSARAAIVSDVVRRAAGAGWLVVIDAPALSRSDLALDCAEENSFAALVVGRGRSRPVDVLSAAELFDAHDSRFVGVILNDVPAGLPSRNRSDDASSTLALSAADARTPAVGGGRGQSSADADAAGGRRRAARGTAAAADEHGPDGVVPGFPAATRDAGSRT